MVPYWIRYTVILLLLDRAKTVVWRRMVPYWIRYTVILLLLQEGGGAISYACHPGLACCCRLLLP